MRENVMPGRLFLLQCGSLSFRPLWGNVVGEAPALQRHGDVGKIISNMDDDDDQMTLHYLHFTVP